MIKNILFVPASARQNTWLIALLCVITLGASACGGLPSNSLTPTPTTLMGVLPPSGQSTGISTEMPIAVTADSGSTADVCALITQSEAETVLGQKVTSITPRVDTNSIPGETLHFCTYVGSGLAVVVSTVDMGSAQAAGQEMQTQLAKMQADTTSTTTSQAGGPGDQIYWSTSLHAASFTVLKGQSVFSVLLGGNIGDSAAYKAGLLKLSESVAAKL